MRNRPEQVVKLVCLLLVAVLGIQLARVIARGTPLKNLSVPALPRLAADLTNAPAGQSAKGTNVTSTNAASTNASSTNVTSTNASSTNATSTNVASTTVAKTGTNSSIGKSETKGTNSSGELKTDGTNIATSEPESKGTNDAAVVAREGTNASALAGKIGTNDLASNTKTNGTNSIEKTGKAGTNSISAQKSLTKGGGPGGRPEMGKKGPDVPPAIKNRIERITQSEILGPVARPMPMALLGIAGDQAFLRSPEGQTGMIKEGAELGTIKLLKVGTNRVLVEEKGEKKELMIFSGFGGDSLMPKDEKKKEDKKDGKPDQKTEQPKNEEKEKKPNETIKKSA